jgi:hypothetical protein
MGDSSWPSGEGPSNPDAKTASNHFPPVGRDGIQYIVNLACESDFGHRQRETRGLLNCRSRRHG